MSSTEAVCIDGWCFCDPGLCVRPGETTCHPAHPGFEIERGVFLAFYIIAVFYFGYLIYRRLRDQEWKLKFNNTQTVFHTCGLLISVLAIPGAIDAHAIWQTAGTNHILTYFVTVANDTLIDIACITYVHIVASSLDWAEVIMSRKKRAKILRGMSIFFAVVVHLGVFIYALTLSGILAVFINCFLIARSAITIIALFAVHRKLLSFSRETSGAKRTKVQKSIRKWSLFTFLCAATLVYVAAITIMWQIFHLNLAPSLTPNCVDYDDPLVSTEVYAWAIYIFMLAAFSKADRYRSSGKTKPTGWKSNTSSGGTTCTNSHQPPSKDVTHVVECTIVTEKMMPKVSTDIECSSSMDFPEKQSVVAIDGPAKA